MNFFKFNWKTTLTSIILPAVLCISLSSCSSDSNNPISEEVTLPPPPPTQQDNVTVTTFAGNSVGNAGSADGTGIAARFWYPWGITMDASGNLYVADTYNNRIRKVTPEGVVTTLAGNTQGYADGVRGAAQFDNPTGIAIDASGNLYVVDTYNNCIRKVTPEGEVTTLAGSAQGYADGKGSAAQFNRPFGIAIDASGNLYVADSYNNRIRKVTPEGEVTTLAGGGNYGADGMGSIAQFNRPFGITIGTEGNLYVADRYRIRKVTPEGMVSTLAGGTHGYADGMGNTAQFDDPNGIAVDASGNLYVGDGYNIRKITPAGMVTTLVVNSWDGYVVFNQGTTAAFSTVGGIVIDESSGSLYITDQQCIRKIEFK